MRVDHSPFEGVEVTGRTQTVLLRGNVVIDQDAYVGEPGDGRFLPAGPAR
jgi:dihydropyrimidinase